MTTTADIQNLVSAGALFVANHSGGKDSQAMLIEMLKIIPREQIIVVHASLGEMEWPGALELAQKQAADAGLPFIVARAAKSFLQMVEQRFATRPDAPSWPSAKYRQCTSDLKRGPIEREIRRYIKAENDRREQVMPISIVVSCTGLRAQESSSRAKLATFTRNARNSKAGRTWIDWLPIHTLSTTQVFATIAAAGQQAHPAYAAGNERLSCVFCIMGSKNDLRRGALANPELFARYVELENRTGYTMHMSQLSLTELVAQAAAAEQPTNAQDDEARPMNWQANGSTLEAYAEGRLRFAVVREKSGWKLYRYSQRGTDTAAFKSKESVRNKTHGRNYADNLWRLATHSQEATFQRENDEWLAETFAS